ncbi:inositol hexakisphosphate and diphosphoinositol-pentakisphosphate kinase 2-like isoform X2 [Apostichopus japonicus]|uniref:inositol hexakisphosphate and diphosphoinositol-pentakisphosphate kinase 2-like isoform X2 n=1 Tax=Stichopus japonicus TaxID=307972 RepID=UPI003AB2D514
MDDDTPTSVSARFFLDDDPPQDTVSVTSTLNPWDTDLKVNVGVCAMAKKSGSKPMQEILSRLSKFDCILPEVFPEEMILNEPVEDWPQCDCLVSFFSTGFPLEKAIAYANLRKPLIINDLENQFTLMDRRKVFRILKENDIPVPRHAVLDRAYDPVEVSMQESEDHVEVSGSVFQKPFVEKPISAEDHNVYIYFPTSAGGGSQRLFRKRGNRSSQYSSESRLRPNGSYIYEEFMPTDGTDVKVYTVGPDYAHAEARKSPALDGKVERDNQGKEIRYPVILNNQEKLIAKKICHAFKQFVCGFDLLRAHGKSYVCDVNGFSFVKNSKKYYDDCAKILGNLIMRKIAPKYNIPWQMFTLDEEIPFVPTTHGTMMELRCVIAVIRHGDRTPKQKMKMEVKHRKFFQLFENYGGLRKKKIKLKRPEQLQKVLDVARSLLDELHNQKHENQMEIEERESKLEQLKAVLEMYGYFSGINRKVQMKLLDGNKSKQSSSEEVSAASKKGSGRQSAKGEQSILLILKWGGELTPAGRVQAEELGRAFRCIYPGGQGDYAGFPGCGLLRLHSTYRHDLKIYASDEGRVQMTAAAFTKGMLALEGELTPILVQMVKSANTSGLLEHEKDSNTIQSKVKEKLYDQFRKDRVLSEEEIQELAPTTSKSLTDALRYIKNSVTMCERVHRLIKTTTEKIKELILNPDYKGLELYHNESLDLMLRRWSKLDKDFKTSKGLFDITKIPDIYDCVKYDSLHNYNLRNLGFDHMDEFYNCAEALATVIIPQEYGMTSSEKLDVGTAICTPLLKKIRRDLQRINSEEETTFRLNPVYSHGVLSPDRHVRTRLYFTSESHIHSLLSCIRYGGLCSENDPQWQRAQEYLSAVKELNYMTQIVIMLYEDPSKDPSSEERFRVELHFSPGAKAGEDKDTFPNTYGYRSCGGTGNASPIENMSENEMDDYETKQSDQSLASKHDSKTETSRTSLPSIQLMSVLAENEKSKAQYSRKEDSIDEDAEMSVFNRGLFNVSSAPQLTSSDWLFSQEVFRRRATHLSSHQGLLQRLLQEYSKSVPTLSGCTISNKCLEHHMQLSSVCPLETLHNSLSLKQIDEFFGRISQHYMRTMEFNVRQNSPASKRFVHKDLSDHSGYSRSASNPSSNVSSAWPSPENTRHTFDLTKIMNKLQDSQKDDDDDVPLGSPMDSQPTTPNDSVQEPIANRSPHSSCSNRDWESEMDRPDQWNTHYRYRDDSLSLTDAAEESES